MTQAIQPLVCTTFGVVLARSLVVLRLKGVRQPADVRGIKVLDVKWIGDFRFCVLLDGMPVVSGFLDAFSSGSPARVSF